MAAYPILTSIAVKCLNTKFPFIYPFIFFYFLDYNDPSRTLHHYSNSVMC